MDYKVIVTVDAEEDLDRFIKYLLLEKKSMQAAQNVLNDFEATKEKLKQIAGSLKYCDNPRLNKLGYRRINFLIIDILCCIVLVKMWYLLIIFFTSYRIMKIKCVNRKEVPVRNGRNGRCIYLIY